MPVVEVRARFAGEVEVLVTAGQAVPAGIGLVVVEGDKEIERLAAKANTVVSAVHVKTGDAVAEGQLLLTLR